ncbi:MAG: BatD family protein [Planctomycetota bacterium]
MDRLLRITAWLFLAITLAAGATAQSGSAPIVRARLSTGVARLGSEISLVVEVEGTREAALGALPAVDGLRLGPVGPMGSSFQTMWDGRRRTEVVKVSWDVPVRPLRTGNFTIPAIQVDVRGRTLATPELALKVVQDMQGEDLGYLRIDVPEEVVEGQPFTLDLVFGYDGALGEIGSQINYFNLSLPWLDQLPGILELDAPPPASGAASVGPVVLNSRGTTTAERIPSVVEGNRTMLALRIRKRYLATRSGPLHFPTSHLEFGQVTRGGIFDMGPAEKQTYYKRFPEFTIEVLELPEAGRPLEYTGAVGTLSARATVDRFDVDAGDSIKLSVEWTGDGNLEFFDVPDPSRIDAFAGFHLFGTTERKTPERRVATYDIAPKSEAVRAIPPLPLSVYDPARKAYVTVSTDEIPIRVRPLENASGLTEEVSRPEKSFDLADIQTEPSREGDLPRPGGGTIGAVFAAIPLLWLGLRTAVRRRADPDAPISRARRAAKRVLRRDLAGARTASDQARALQRFLAARTGEPAQAWVGRDAVRWAHGLLERNARGGGAVATLSDEHARALAELLATLDERAWARGDAPIDAREIERVADRVAGGGL